MLVVFDFDKTLTKKDTLFGFYREVDGDNPFFNLKRAILLFFALLFKVKIISNTSLKCIGIWLYLKGHKKEKIDLAAQNYSRKIPLNDIYHSDYKSFLPEQKMICSASLEDYLLSVFPGDRVYGSKLIYHRGHVHMLGRNLYGYNKLKLLQEMGIGQIDILYTDSLCDKSLIHVSKQVFLVRNGKKTIYK